MVFDNIQDAIYFEQLMNSEYSHKKYSRKDYEYNGKVVYIVAASEDFCDRLFKHYCDGYCWKV